MDNNFNSTPKTSHTGRAFLGFLLTFFVVVFFIIQGLTISLKSSFLKGNSIASTLESMGFYDTLQELIVSEISNNAGNINLSEDAVNKIFSKNTIAEVSEVFTEAIIDGKDVDISFIKDDCLDITKSVTSSVVDTVVDTVFKEFNDSSKTIDISSITSNSNIKQLEADYGISVTKTIEDTISSKFGTTTIDLSVIDSNDVRESVDKALVDTLYPTISTAFDTYSDDINALINESVDEIKSDYNLDMAFKKTDSLLKSFSLTNIVIIVISIVLVCLEILLYRKEMRRGFRNIAIASLLSGIFYGIITMAITFVKDLIFSNLNTFEKAEKVVKDFVEQLVNNFYGCILIICIVYIVVSISCFIASSILKAKERKFL